MSAKLKVKTVETAAVDSGLKSYLLKVYNFMGIGLLLTALSAYLCSSTAVLSVLFKTTSTGAITGYSGIGYLTLASPLILIFVFQAAVSKMSPTMARLVFLAFAVLNGLSLGPLFLVYAHASLVTVFLITAGTFFAMSIYGYTTGRDLTKLGSFLFMGLIGLLIASVVNIFLASPMMFWVISFIGVGVFTGLVAVDTQRIKQMYYLSSDENVRQVMAINGALALYLDFLNLFLYLLRLMGNSKN